MVEERTPGQKLSVGAIPRAAIAYIPGSYTHICLVLIDSSSADFPSSQDYNVQPGISAKRAGEPEFAKYAMAYLGRTRVDQGTQYKPEDCVHAMNHMCEMFMTRRELRRLHLKASVLCTSRYNGYGIYPDPQKPPKADGKDEKDRDHTEGTYQFNSKYDLKIGDHVLRDIGDYNEDSQKHIMLNRLHWRTDPLCFFSYGAVNVSRDATHAPSMWKLSADCIQYQATESPAPVRILRAAGVYTRDPEAVRHVFMNSLDMFNTTVAYGSLLLGLTNWAACELGVTMFEHNRLGKRQRCIDDSYRLLWPELTQGFVIKTRVNSDRIVDDALAASWLGMSMNLATLKKNIKVDWFDTHYSWNVPWWYVSALAERFGHKYTIEAQPNVEYFEDENDNMMGSLIEMKTSKQTDLSILTSSCEYERRVRRNRPSYFEIRTPTSNGKDEAINFVSWNANAFIDATKNELRSGLSTELKSLDGVCELNVIVFPSMRSKSMKTCPRAFVADNGRVDARDESTYPCIVGGLRYPDSKINCLPNGETTVIQPLLSGYLVGALTDEKNDSTEEFLNHNTNCSREEPEIEHIANEQVQSTGKTVTFNDAVQDTQFAEFRSMNRG
ncbi:uncharacterized protein LOC117788498 [Drosophila innubila]|uniref:uncharacterized protein LOC117788498 n=1 Tax=Drosophila innubila TaxID=198719 RepID=UPI00148D052B|nr:uncharacterized protein LOC117788498 [Drosophila innubila]